MLRSDNVKYFARVTNAKDTYISSLPTAKGLTTRLAGAREIRVFYVCATSDFQSRSRDGRIVKIRIEQTRKSRYKVSKLFSNKKKEKKSFHKLFFFFFFVYSKILSFCLAVSDVALHDVIPDVIPLP